MHGNEQLFNKPFKDLKNSFFSVHFFGEVSPSLLIFMTAQIVTIFHWDLPQWLHLLGGVTNPLFVDHITMYSDVLFKAFGHKVLQTFKSASLTL